jgi:hypothetical protein
LTNPNTGQLFEPPGFQGLLGGASYTSFVNGATLPNAWNVELDIPTIGQATPQGGGLIRIWGISLQEIAQASNLKNYNVKVFAGMQKGLPLANPAQAGLIAQGYVFQAFGNWVETDMTLDFVIYPGTAPGTGSTAPTGTGTLSQPANLVLNWKAGTPLGTALFPTLTTAFPGYPPTININSGIVKPNDQVGYFPTLEQLAQYCAQVSKDVIKTSGYPGVSIVMTPNNTISVFDGSAPAANPKQIAFQDLIGQPTWIESPNIQYKTVMRADLSVGDSIMLPPTLITNTAAAASSLVNQQASFQGGFTLVSERHVGNFRAPQADAWVTVFEGAPNQVSGTT